MILYICDRILCIVLRGHWYDGLNVHSQTEGTSDGTKDNFYEELGRYLDRLSSLK
jgi:hypothetical protein